jgi:hypothetical protein
VNGNSVGRDGAITHRNPTIYDEDCSIFAETPPSDGGVVLYCGKHYRRIVELLEG